MNYFGLFATIFSIVAASGGLLLQIIKIHKLKRAEQLSMGWLTLGVATWLSWTIYGISQRDVYVLIANGIGLVFQSVLLIVVLRYRKNKYE